MQQAKSPAANHMDNIDFNNKNKDFVFDVGKHCAVCKINGHGPKKKVIYLSQTRSCKVCVACMVRFPSTGDLMRWLQEHAIFDRYGRITNFSEEKQREVASNGV